MYNIFYNTGTIYSPDLSNYAAFYADSRLFTTGLFHGPGELYIFTQYSSLHAVFKTDESVIRVPFKACKNRLNAMILIERKSINI